MPDPTDPRTPAELRADAEALVRLAVLYDDILIRQIPFPAMDRAILDAHFWDLVTVDELRVAFRAHVQGGA